MFVKQLYTNCLSEAAYFVASDGEAVVIDPLRDIDTYTALAKEHNAVIKYIFETHFHADFVSGHLELAKATGASIVYGPDAQTGFETYHAKDGELFNIGKLRLRVMHTPGHTLESTCYILQDEQHKDYCVFTGDTLFVGDVGRPDLFSGNLSKEELAAYLYDSLHTKIASLEDHVLVYPAHGPGSACGKNLGPNTHSTIAEQKQTNYALAPQTKEEFIQAVTSGLNAPPAYFPINAAINKKGYESLDMVKTRGLQALSIADFKAAVAKGALIVDTRKATEFTEGFIPESISIGLDGRFAEWAGTLLPFNQDLVLVAEEGKEEETLIRLARVGLDAIQGFLKGGFEAWKAADEKIDIIIDVDTEELALDIPHDPKLEIIDVRKQAEFDAGHIVAANLMPLDTLIDPLHLSVIDTEANLYVHCAGGYRSVIACSLLKRQGFHNVRNVLGGWSAIKEVNEIPKEMSSVMN
jgi:glyoxylase-like metal-dependent hydrolase (beta-lactamase superfamily II)/rhodanese-related sulfurtransferase